jgi:hypothetical protein
MQGSAVLGIALVLVGLLGAVVLIPLSMMSTGVIGDWPQSEDYGRSSLSMERTEYLANQYLASLNDPDLAVKEIMEFEQNFYVIYYERSTGVGAFEVLIWKTGENAGRITPEPGPNMMWNTKYGGMMGHMGGGMMGGGMMGGYREGEEPTADMPIGEDQAKKIGQEYLDQYSSGSTIVESTKFYGYYTFDFAKDGEIQGMFSVNGYSGQVWYHGWHGAFIGMEEYGEEHGE